MTTDVRTWVPLATWWIPVWVTLQTERTARDPLETAVLGLVGFGRQRVTAMATQLCVNAGLVQSAVDHLLALGAVEVDEQAWISLPKEAATSDGALEKQRGYIAWDSSPDRPLLQLWLDDDVAATSEQFQGWTMIDHDAVASPKDKPSQDKIAKWLHLLPNISDLRVFEPFGSGARELDGSTVAKLRLRPNSPLRANPVWVPVEERALGAVVWRPSMVPRERVQTELDPGGWDGLLDRVPRSVREELEKQHRRYRDLVMPGVVKEAGFASLDDFKLSMESKARQMLGDIQMSDRVWNAAVDAVAMQKLGETIDADWRMLAKPWAALLDLATLEVAIRVRPALERITIRVLREDETNEVRALLAENWGYMDKVAWGKSAARDMDALRDHLIAGTDTLGLRQLLFSLCATFDCTWRERFLECDRKWPGFFSLLHRAVQIRNTVEHERAAGALVDVDAFRAQVVRVVQALSGLT